VSLRARLRDLFGRSAKAAPKSAAKPPRSSGVADSARAKLIAEALAIHRAQGERLRGTIMSTIDELQRGGAKTLRDPEALARLMALIQARRTMAGLMAGGLKRYLVLGGLRELLGRAPPPDPPKAKVTRR
jgi:hypothetical protein